MNTSKHWTEFPTSSKLYRRRYLALDPRRCRKMKTVAFNVYLIDLGQTGIFHHK